MTTTLEFEVHVTGQSHQLRQNCLKHDRWHALINVWTPAPARYSKVCATVAIASEDETKVTTLPESRFTRERNYYLRDAEIAFRDGLRQRCPPSLANQAVLAQSLVAQFPERVAVDSNGRVYVKAADYDDDDDPVWLALMNAARRTHALVESTLLHVLPPRQLIPLILAYAIDDSVHPFAVMRKAANTSYAPCVPSNSMRFAAWKGCRRLC